MKLPERDAKNAKGRIRQVNGTNVTPDRQSFHDIMKGMKGALITWFQLDCWVDFLVCPRRYLALLPAHARANLFAGD